VKAEPRRSSRLSTGGARPLDASLVAAASPAAAKRKRPPVDPKSPSKAGRTSQGVQRPTPAECWYAARALAAIHGDVSLHKLREGTLLESALPQPEDQRTVLDSLVRTMLSQNTTDILSQRAYSSLKKAFPTWEAVRTADPRKIEDAVRCGGRAATLAARFQELLNTLVQERGECSLEYVREMSDAEVKEELARFKGVGSKTISCVMMFCLRRPEFPVDTHIWRISKNAGWVMSSASREDTYDHMNSMVPDEIKFDLHVLLVEHGKRCKNCAKNGNPRKGAMDAECPLTAKKLAALVCP